MASSSSSSSLQLLQALRLRKILKESHSDETCALVRNELQPSCGNVLATVGGNQLNVYDNAHFGTRLDLFVAYRNPDGDRLCTCCFVLPHLGRTGRGGGTASRDAQATAAEGGDAREIIVAVGSERGYVRLVSVARALEFAALDHHQQQQQQQRETDEGGGADERRVTALAAHPCRPGVFASAAGDSIKVWQLPPVEEELPEQQPQPQPTLVIRGVRASALAFRDNGALYVAHARARQVLEFDTGSMATTTTTTTMAATTAALTASDGRVFAKRMDSTPVALRCGPRGVVIRCADTVRYLAYDDGANLIANGAKRGGAINIPDGSGARHASMDVCFPRTVAAAAAASSSASAVDERDEALGFVCVGNSSGSVYVFNLSDGKRVACVSHERYKGAVGGCVFGEEQATLVAACGPLVCRFVAEPETTAAAAAACERPRRSEAASDATHESETVVADAMA